MFDSPFFCCFFSFLFFSGVYPEPGTWWRICGFANDIVGPKSDDGHSRWDPKIEPVLLFDEADARYGETDGIRYLGYGGTFGEDGVNPPHRQGWWNDENQYTNNFFRRCLWPCRYIEWEGDDDYCYHTCQKKVDFGSSSSVSGSSAQVTPSPAGPEDQKIQ